MSADDALSAGLVRSVLDELPLGVWVARAPSGEVLYANRTSAEILGERDRNPARPATVWLDRQGRPYPAAELPFARAVRERTRVVAEDIVVVNDGQRRNVRALAQPLINVQNELTHVVLVFADISAQVTAEQERETARSQLLIALHHAPIALFTLDRQGTVTLSEGAGLRALDVESGELVGGSAFEMFRDNPEVLGNLLRAMKGDSFTATTQHGESTLESWLAPLRDQAGEIQGVIGISHDITERQRLQRQVAHADRISALGRLAASVAHEINNPLSYTLEALRLCQERATTLEATAAFNPALEELQRLLADAAEGAERVRLITRDLTTFARADSGPRRAVALDEAALAASKLVNKRSTARGEVLLDLQCGRSVGADEHRLVQVFVNLILNAADALPADSTRRHRIRVSTRTEQTHAVIEVADSGPGLSEPARAHLFEPFYSTKPLGEGTGLGLYVTHNIVTALGGDIAVSTAPEGGALFRIRLPLAPEGEGLSDAPEPAASPSQRPPAKRGSSRPAPPSAAPPKARPRVMVIDDEAVLAHVFGIALQDDCDVNVFESGRAGLEHLLSGERYDLIFCDLMMRDLSGMDLYRELAAHAPGRERELIFMTGGTFDPEVSAFVQRISNPCITKPFDIRSEVRKRVATR